MQSLDPARHSQILLSLDELAQRQRTARKLLVCNYSAEGKELLRSLALAGHGWIGFEPTDPKKLANELVAHDIARDGLRIADSFDLDNILDHAIDDTLARNSAGFSADVRQLAEHVGFRKAIRRSINALRLEGIDSPALRCADLEDLPKRNFLADIYAGYEQKLRQARLADTADVFRRATIGVQRATIILPRATVVLMPGLSLHGLAGRFIEALRGRGALLLQDDAANAESPRFTLAATSTLPGAAVTRSIDIFAASSPTHEIKEVLRRCIAQGLAWDEVEIIATDANVYGCALDALARRLNIPVSYAIGLPASRTPPGRVMAAYLRWIQEDFSDEIMRALLESGDIAPEGEARTSGVSLARALRRLRIGWGRDRYLRHIAAEEQRLLGEQHDADEDERADVAERRRDELAELHALRVLFTPILEATPAIPNRLRGPARISPAAIANGMFALLRCTLVDHDVDRIAREKIQARLERIRATLTRELSFESAVAMVRERLQIRVPAVGATGPAPWTTSPGHLHLSSIDHGGFIGRRATFIVGLDAGRHPRATLRDPLLGDDDRRIISPALITTAERAQEAHYRFATMFARLRGTVTLSYSAYDTVEARKLGPAAVVLEAFRARTNNPAANYDDLRKAVEHTASAVARPEAVLDTDDVWLSAMSDNGVLRASQHLVRNAFANLDAGLNARERRNEKVPNAHHGLVAPRSTLDPRRNRMAVSPSRMEALGSCGLRYFYRYVLGIKPPDVPEFDPEVWLDPRNRGSLLHDVFEQTLRTAREQGVEVLSSAFDDVARETLDRLCREWREKVPPPSDTVYLREVTALRNDVQSFADMCRQDGANWRELELPFGDENPVEMPLPGGTIELQGRIDRVDEAADGRLVVIDYKTGSSFKFTRGVFDGGRRLQHYMYMVAAAKLLNAQVARMEYRFPSARVDEEKAVFSAIELGGAAELIDGLLDNVAQGRFLPTDKAEDCTFCDFRECCRVAVSNNKTTSPPAAWAHRLAPVPDEYKPLVELRERFK